MSHVPPPYAPQPEEGKGIYPSVPPPQQQPPPPGGYYPPQAQPQPLMAPTAPPGQEAVTYYPGTGPQQPMQQQQPQLLVVEQPAPAGGRQQPVQSFVLHIVMSCFVFWCCGFGCFCGLVAFILARKYEQQYVSKRRTRSARLPYQYCSKNVSGYRRMQEKLRIVQYRYGSLSTRSA